MVVVGVVILVGVVVIVVVVILEPDRLDPVGCHHADAAKVRRLDQPVQPAFEREPVEHENLGLAHGSRIGGTRLVDVGVTVGPHQAS